MQYSHFVKAPTCVLRHMFKELVHDSSAAIYTIEQQVDERVAKATSRSWDIIMDLRKNNGIVRERASTWYLPIAISVRDLREIVCERLAKEFPREEKPILS